MPAARTVIFEFFVEHFVVHDVVEEFWFVFEDFAYCYGIRAVFVVAEFVDAVAPCEVGLFECARKVLFVDAVEAGFEDGVCFRFWYGVVDLFEEDVVELRVGRCFFCFE